MKRKAAVLFTVLLITVCFTVLGAVMSSGGLYAACAEGEQLYSNAADVVRYIRSQVRNVVNNVTLYVTPGAYADLDPEMRDIFSHTGNGGEGDYLNAMCLFHSVTADSQPDGNYRLEYYFAYFIEPEKESCVADAVEGIAADIGLNDSGKSDLDKLEAIYSWITQNVSYDYETLGEGSAVHPEKYTAYSAAVEKNSVCQGISSLFYRLALKAGFDCRIIRSNEMSHAWNIIRYNDLYYLCDATWDLGTQQGYWQYFMRGKNDFAGHSNSDDEFTNAAFRTSYPLADSHINTRTGSADKDILGYMTAGTYLCPDGRSFSPVGNGTNKILIFFGSGCEYSHALFESLCGKEFPDVSIYGIFNSYFFPEDGLANLPGELAQFQNPDCVTFAVNGGYTDYAGMLERETGIYDGFAHSPTVFFVDDQDRILFAGHGFTGNMVTAAAEYFNDTVRNHNSQYHNHNGDHTWETLRVLREAADDHDGKKTVRCTVCGKTDIAYYYTASTVVSGRCGDELTWHFDTASATLTISGTGAMWDMNCYMFYPGDGGRNNTGWATEDFPRSAMFCDQAIDVRDVRHLIVGEGVTHISICAFEHFTSLVDAVLPDSLTTISDCAFIQLPCLQSITIPRNVTEIGIRVYEACNAVTSVSVAKDNPVYRSENNCLIKGDELLYGFGTSTIPRSVTRIGNRAFGWIRTITDMTIPGNISCIGAQAFEGCRDLTKLTLSASVQEIGISAFYDCDMLTDIYYLGTQEDRNSMTVDIQNYSLDCALWHYADYGDLIQTVLPSSIVTIESEAFCGIGTQVIIIPASCEYIAEDAFDGCDKLMYIVNRSDAVVTAPTGVTVISE